MRIEIVEYANRLERKPLLTEAFALRHRVFVEDRGWEFLRRSDSLDMDRYDGGETTHVLLLDGDRVEGHARLVPGGYLAVARADPARIREVAGDGDIYGLSRFCVAPWVKNSMRRRVLNACLFMAALRVVIARGSHTLLFETDPSMLLLLRVLGFSIDIVGEPAPIAGRQLQPVVVRLDVSVLSGLPVTIAMWTEGAPGIPSGMFDALS